jgi:hypothetical protein
MQSIAVRKAGEGPAETTAGSTAAAPSAAKKKGAKKTHVAIADDDEDFGEQPSVTHVRYVVHLSRFL